MLVHALQDSQVNAQAQVLIRWPAVKFRGYNVAMMFFEGDRRRPEKDSVDVIKGAGSSYANFIIPLKESQIPTFNKDLKSATNNTAVLKVLKKYGLSRSAPDFWKTYNKVSDLALIKSTNERGKIDLNRYINL